MSAEGAPNATFSAFCGSMSAFLVNRLFTTSTACEGGCSAPTMVAVNKEASQRVGDASCQGYNALEW